MSTELYDGILFIGDPHVCSRKVGRRKDDYLESVRSKLSACARLCTEHNLLPVILGDLFHRNDDNNLRMLNRLIRVLREFPSVPFVLEGNHDKAQTQLTEDDALALMELAGAVRLTGAGEVGVFSIKGQPVRLWGCPYGTDIPTSLPAFAGTTVMTSHHDLAFDSAYPGSRPLHEIENCQLVVNGHMHGTKAAQYRGVTWWANPGNIEPLSVDLIAHVPKAWRWAPDLGAGNLDGIELPHGTDLFDLNGIQVEASEPGAAVKALTDGGVLGIQSKFAQMLKGQELSDAQKTDDASVLAEDLEAVLTVAGVSDASRNLMQTLLSTLGSNLATS